MPQNVLQVGPQIFAVVAGIIVLLGAALAFAFRYRTGAEAGRRGHLDEADEEPSRIGPSGFIQTFAGRIEEAGGGLPYTGAIIMVVTGICYFVYLFVFWNPR